MRLNAIRVCSVALTLLAAVSVPWGVSAGGELPLTVTEPSGVARRGDVVTSGVPFPKGALAEGQPVALADSQGRPVRAEAPVMARWADRSAMWVLLDFQTDLAPGETRTFRLLWGPEAAAIAPRPAVPPAVQVAESPEAILVDTGELRATINARAFSLIAAAQCRTGDGAWRPVLSAPGEMFLDIEHTPPGPPQEEDWLRRSAVPGAPADRFAPGLSKKPFSAAVEWRSPLRVVVRLDGWCANAEGREEFPYTVRLTFHAGKPWVWITHTVVFTGDVKQDFLRRMALRHRLALDGDRRIRLGGGVAHDVPAGRPWASLLEPGNSVLRHLVPYTDVKPVGYQVDAGDSAANHATLARGEWARGWASLAGGDRGITVAVRHFDKLFPKELAVESAGVVTQYLWPDRGDQVMDLRRRYDYVDNKGHYDLGMYPKGGRGLSLTHESLLWFHAAAVPSGDIEAAVAAFGRRLFALAPAAWYGESGVMPAFHPRDPGRFPRLEAFIDLAMEWRLRNVAQFGWYGLLDFGDTMFHGYETRTHAGETAPKSWCSRGYVGWLCNDGAPDRAVLMHFLRSGDRRLFDHWEALVRHVAEVDCVHYDENPAVVGGGHRHDQQHWGNILTGYGTATFGTIEMFLLTGDLRSLDVYQEHVNFHRGGGGGEDEYVGLPQAYLAAVTGDAALIEEARAVVRSNHYGFRTGASGQLDQPHFRCPTIQHPSLLGYLAISEDAEMRDFWVAVARQRAASLSLGEGALQFASAWRFTRDPIFLQALKLHWSTWGPYCRPRLQDFHPDKVFEKPLRDMPFDELAELARGCVNNLYGIYQHAAVLPQVMAVASQAGLSEADLLDSPPRLARCGVAWDWGWAGKPVAGIDRTRVRTLDLRPAANANPWNELRTTGAPLAGDPPVARQDVLRLDFLSWGDVEPGCYPVRPPSLFPVVFPADFTVREEGCYMSGLPWGGRIEMNGVPFDLLHPSANRGKAAVVLGDRQTVSIPVGVAAKRLFLLGMVADKAPFDTEAGVSLSLRCAGAPTQTIELRNLEHYERWNFWGLASKALLARAFKVSAPWDGLTTVLNVLEVPLPPAPVQEVQLTDLGKGHRLVVLAASIETEAAAAVPAGTRVCYLVKPAGEGEGWIEGREAVKPAGSAVVLEGPATYRVKVPPGSYRVDFEATGTGGGLAEALICGRPACSPFTLSQRELPGGATPTERMSVWGRGDDKGLDIVLRNSPGKGLWRHHTVHRQPITLRYLAVTPETPPPHAPVPCSTVCLGWAEPMKDAHESAARPYSWTGAGVGESAKAEQTMIVGAGKARFRVALPPGRYQVALIAAALRASDPRVGLVRPGPAVVELQDGKNGLLERPEDGKTSRLDFVTTVGDEGLVVAIQPAESAETWGLALMEARPVKTP